MYNNGLMCTVLVCFVRVVALLACHTVENPMDAKCSHMRTKECKSRIA
jgi:hypothetical protein